MKKNNKRKRQAENTSNNVLERMVAQGASLDIVCKKLEYTMDFDSHKASVKYSLN